MKQVGYKEAIQAEWLKFIQLEEVVEVQMTMYKIIYDADHLKLFSFQLK